MSTVLAADEIEELGSVVDEGGPRVALDERRVSEERGEERDIGLDAADAELDESTEQLPASNLIGRTMANDLDKHA